MAKLALLATKAMLAAKHLGQTNYEQKNVVNINSSSSAPFGDVAFMILE